MSLNKIREALLSQLDAIELSKTPEDVQLSVTKSRAVVDIAREYSKTCSVELEALALVRDEKYVETQVRLITGEMVLLPTVQVIEENGVQTPTDTTDS